MAKNIKSKTKTVKNDASVDVKVFKPMSAETENGTCTLTRNKKTDRFDLVVDGSLIVSCSNPDVGIFRANKLGITLKEDE
jgi:hypothetical protein